MNTRKLKKRIRELTLEMFTSDYNDWDFDSHYATHIPTKISWWRANGFSYFKSKGRYIIKLGYLKRLKLWRWLKVAEMAQIIKSDAISEMTNINKDEKAKIMSKWSELQNFN